jgi:hypothetical protein
VLQLIARDYMYKEIAARLHLSVSLERPAQAPALDQHE